jgi:hypothetical protein
VADPDAGSEQRKRDPSQPPVGCSGCCEPLRWERIADGWGERWLAVCECGEIAAFFADRRHPTEQPPEPLVMALQGHRAPRRPATPAWVRVFLLSQQPPHQIQWRHHYERGPACDSPARFGFLTWPDPATAAICSLCLSCGHTVSHQQQPATGEQQPPLEGTQWTPPCLAVKQLRRCIFRTGRPVDDDGSVSG